MRTSIRNPFVMRMTTAELAELDGERIELRKQAVLGRVNQPLTHVVFPERGLVSTIKSMSDDRSCTVGYIDNRGMVGIGALFLTERSTADYVVALAGEGLRVERERLLCVLRRNPQLDALFKQLAHVAWGMNAQTSACNRLHDFEPRLCRWLMVASNAIGALDLPVHQTEVARLLGVSRNQVGLVLKKLTADGMVRVSPARIQLTDKARIEANACECYATVAGRLARIFSNARLKNDFSVNGAMYVARHTTP